MDSSQLFLELLESGERLNVALADARKADVVCAGGFSYTRWQSRLRMAHREVERAAESYAVALKTYRVAILAELAPSEPAKSRRSGKTAKRPRRAHAMSAACVNVREPADRNARKDVGAERFPVSTVLSLIQ